MLVLQAQTVMNFLPINSIVNLAIPRRLPEKLRRVLDIICPD
jgi:hypothetical protein